VSPRCGVDDIADAARWFTSETYTTTVAADEEKFIDRSRTPLPLHHRKARSSVEPQRIPGDLTKGTRATPRP